MRAWQPSEEMIERLRLILERENNRDVDIDEASCIAESLVSYYESLSKDYHASKLAIPYQEK